MNDISLTNWLLTAVAGGLLFIGFVILAVFSKKK